MKKAIIVTLGVIWIASLGVVMTKAFAWEQYNEKTAVNSDYNKQQTNPTNYHKDEGYGMTRSY